MIVNVTCPADVDRVKYGQASFPLNGATVLEVPAFVAKSIVEKDGFSCTENLSAPHATLLSAAADFEANYLFLAYGLPTGTKAEAADLLAERGPPNVRIVF